MTNTMLRTIAVLLCLAPGCASITEAPKLFGGTRALLARPFPITDASIKLGREKPLRPGVAGLVLLNLYWIVDFPLSVVMDTLMAPIAYFVFDERGKSSEDDEYEASAKPRHVAPTPVSSDDPNSIPDDPLSPDFGG